MEGEPWMTELWNQGMTKQIQYSPTSSKRGYEYPQLNAVYSFFTYEPRCEKTGLQGLYQVPHKPGCTSIEYV